jgi:CelD/BcsL family acetyltransferase involved in cellulose biosynthesis
MTVMRREGFADGREREPRADAERRALAAGAGDPNPFYAPMLLDAALAHLPDPAVRLVEARQGEVLIGLLPVVPARRHGRVPVAHCANWLHRHCFYGAPLLAAGAEEAGWAGLLAALDAAPWSGHFLHLRGLDAEGPAARSLLALCARQGRRIEAIAHHERALLDSPLSAEDYLATHMRPKKRKELRRLQARLADCGVIAHHRLTDPAALPAWCDAFLTLEASGWKGDDGTALVTTPADAAFFHAACAAASAEGALDMLRIDCDGRPIAMLVSFLSPPGAFSFKIATDAAFARYSPGVLVEIDNLARILDDRAAQWMDSCAEAGHPMIESLWAERRTIAQYRVALRKPAAGVVLAAIGAAERVHATVKPWITR